jgi:hypothetical protein
MRHHVKRSSLAILVVLWTALGCGEDAEPEAQPDAGCLSEPAPQSAWRPPFDPSSPAAEGPGGVTFALRRIYFGETPWDDVGAEPNYLSWKLFGFDLDGLVTTRCSRDHCISYPGFHHTDGPDGLDNTFGSGLMQLLSFYEPTATMSQAMELGKSTYLIRLQRTDLSQSANQIPAAFLTAADRGASPAWDSSDVWPVTEDSLVGGDVTEPRVTFPDSYLVGDRWVAGPSDSGVIVLQMRGRVLLPRVRLHRPMLAMQISQSDGGLPTARGIIAGVVDPEELIADTLLVAGASDQPVCDRRELVVTMVRQHVDIGFDGTNGDPTVPCTGISVGIGFDAELAQIGAVVPTPIEPTAPCP